MRSVGCLCLCLGMMMYFAPVNAGEAGLPPVRIEAQAGSAVEFPLGLPAGSVSAKGINLPAGLRMSADGTIVGTPLYAGETLASAVALNSQQFTVASQSLLFSIGGIDGASASSRGISVASGLRVSQNPALTGEEIMLTVAAQSSKTLTYEWSFGDGTTQSGGSSATHAYATTGVYTASVKISDGTSEVSESASVTVVATVAQRNAAARAVADPLEKKLSAAPFEQIRLSGVFDPALAYSVRFVVSKTLFIDVEANEVTSTSLTVAVPPVPKGTAFKGGNATLKIIEDGFLSDVEGKLKILDLPKIKVDPGVTTRSFLNAQKSMLEQLKPKLAALGIVPAETLTGVDTQMSTIDTISGRVSSIVTAPKKDRLALAIIKNSDRFVQGILASGGKIGDGALASASTAWIAALQSGDQDAILNAEAAFVAAYLDSVKARGVEQISDGAKFTTGTLGVIGGIFGAAGVILTVTGKAAAGAALVSAGAAVGTAALVIGTTFAVTVGVAGAVAYAAGNNDGKKILNESKEIFVETGKDVLIEKGAGAIAGKIVGVVKGPDSKVTEVVVELVEVGVNAADGAGDLAEAVPELQTSGAFTAALFRSGSSYYVIVKSTSTTNSISVTVTGTDGFATTFTGTGMVTTSVIPAGAAGVTDTVVATDTVTGETQTFAFTF